jgi:phosphoribulokinase
MESCLRFVYDHASPFNTIFDNFSPSTWYSLDMQKNVFFENCGYTGATTDLQNLFAHFDLLSLVFTDPLTSKQFVWLICGFEGRTEYIK